MSSAIHPYIITYKPAKETHQHHFFVVACETTKEFYHIQNTYVNYPCTEQNYNYKATYWPIGFN